MRLLTAHGLLDVQDAETTASGSAAAPAMPQVPQLPVDVLTLILSHIPYNDLAQLRLCSTQFAAAADPLIRSIRLTEWLERPISINSRLQHIRGLDLNFHATKHSCSHSSCCTTAAEQVASNIGSAVQGIAPGSLCGDLAQSRSALATWQQLEAVLKQLPRLSSLALPFWDQDTSIRATLPAELTGFLTQLTRLDLEDLGLVPAGVQLPSLHAASFTSSDNPASLAAIAALAPNLQQLGCRRLEIHTAAAIADTAALDGSGGMSSGPEAGCASVAVLPQLTHFGGQFVAVAGAATAAQAAAAFGNAFPKLQVLYRVPQVCGDADSKDCGYEDLLQYLPHLTAIRGRNWFSSRSWFLIRSSGHLAGDAWRNIQRMSFHSNSYPDGCSDFLDISKSTQLRHLRLTFNYPYTKANELVRELSMLPSLESLALPAALLCSRCCPEKHYPGLRSSLETLAAKTQLTRLDLLTLPEAALGTTFFCGHQSSVRENMESFNVKAAASRQRLMLLQHHSTASQGVVTWNHARQQRKLELHLSVESLGWSDDTQFSRKVCGHHAWGVYVAESE